MRAKFLMAGSLVAASAVCAAGLKDAYKDDFRIGVALAPWQIDNPKATALVKEHFNSIVCENAMKAGSIHPAENRWNFGPADKIVDFAAKNGIEMTGHNLVWHSQTMDWIFRDAQGKDVTREVLEKRLRAHIRGMFSHFKGKVRRWEVVNEAIEEDGSLRNSPWRRILGEDFMETAFRIAHEEDPEAELYYNDYNMENPAKLQRALQLVGSLRSKGLRIDGIGSQTHASLGHPSANSVEKMLAACEQLDVKVSITELDVSVLPWTMERPTSDIAARSEYDRRFDPYRDGLPDSVSKQLSDKYCELFRIFRRYRRIIERVTFWGLDDGQTWLNGWPVPGRVNYPLLFDRGLNPKPCLKALMELKRDVPANVAWFDYLDYSGVDPDHVATKAAAKPGVALNPIVAGYYPDPSVLRVGKKFYLANSTFDYFPGVPVFESNDLVHWKQIGNALSSPMHIDIRPSGSTSHGIYAPALAYNKFNKLFYMITTDCHHGLGNFFVTTTDPAIGWSAPIKIGGAMDGIDPSFFFDDDGKAYIVNCAEPEGGAAYNGQRAIRCFEFDVEKNRIVGREGHSWEIIRGKNGAIWDEGPHLYKINGWYYMMCAEGGTAFNHSEVIYRSKSLKGPWEENPNNPILTQRDAQWGRPNAVFCTGHADLVEDVDGKWYAVFLGTRPRDAGEPLGRETFMLPVEWKDGWPSITPKDEKGRVTVPFAFAKPGAAADGPETTGAFRRFADFKARPGDEFVRLTATLRYPYELYNGWIGLASGANLSAASGVNGDTSVLLRRQLHHEFTLDTKVMFAPRTERDFAGLVLLQDHPNYVAFGKTRRGGKPSLTVVAVDGERKLVAETVLPDGAENADGEPVAVELRMSVKGNKGEFLWRLAGEKEFKSLAKNVELNIAPHHSHTMSFVGNTLGLYTTSEMEYRKGRKH